MTRLLGNVRFTLLVLLSVALTGSCTGAPARSVPPSAPTTHVRMLDFSFAYDSRMLRPGRNTLRFDNVGKLPHSVVLFSIPDGAPSLEVQNEANDFGPEVALATLFTHAPGARGVFAVDLISRGRYAFFCRSSDADGVPHYRKGMMSEFRVE